MPAFDTEKFHQTLKEIRKRCPKMRYGQAVFNVMAEMYPVAANRYRASTIDPFYDDSKAIDFIVACRNFVFRQKGRVPKETVNPFGREEIIVVNNPFFAIDRSADIDEDMRRQEEAIMRTRMERVRACSYRTAVNVMYHSGLCLHPARESRRGGGPRFCLKGKCPLVQD